MSIILNKKLKISLFKTMLKIRHFEEIVKQLYSDGLIPGSVHLYTGEEAIAAGACAALNSDDYIGSTHRGHGHIIARGGVLKKVMAELFGKNDGYNGGRGGSMHIATMDLGILGANSIVGAGIPIATGAALSSKLRKSGQVALSFFGDGAANQGTFHESLNIAANFELPVVYILENNLYGVSGCILNMTKCIELFERAKSYGMPGLTIDGNDPIIVFKTVKDAVQRARNGKGPTLIECKTYRWYSHYEGELDDYRPPEEVKKWKEKDPISRFEKYLISEKIISKNNIDEFQNSIKKEIEDAIEFAKNSLDPLIGDALKFVTT